MARMVDVGVTKLAWAPGDETTIANLAAPTVAELTAVSVKDISCDVPKGYDVSADDSNTTSDSPVCATADGEAPTTAKYHGNWGLYRDINPATGVLETDDLLSVFTDKYPQGFFIRRLGKPYGTAFASGDHVELYHFIVDIPKLSGGTGDGFLKMQVRGIPTGFFKVDAIVAAI